MPLVDLLRESQYIWTVMEFRRKSPPSIQQGVQGKASFDEVTYAKVTSVLELFVVDRSPTTVFELNP